MFAGFDSTSRACTGTIYRLLANPHYLLKLREHLDSELMGSKSLDDALMSNVNGLDLLRYVCKEGLRIDPPAQGSIGYRANKDCKIANVPIRPGTEINVAIHAIHRDPRHWQRPDEFLPERFDPTSSLSKTPDGNRRPSLAFLPFSLGARSCAGQLLA